MSDEQVCAQWLQTPYYQYFTGETYFQHKFPHDRSSLTSSKLSKTATIMAGRYAHAKQHKRKDKQVKFLKTRLGRLLRDIPQKEASKPYNGHTLQQVIMSV